MHSQKLNHDELSDKLKIIYQELLNVLSSVGVCRSFLDEIKNQEIIEDNKNNLVAKMKSKL